MVPTAKEILFSRTFPGQNYHFPGASIQELKLIDQDMCEKAYHIYSMHDWLFKFLWYSLFLTPSKVLAVWSTHFYLKCNYHEISRLLVCTDTFPSTNQVFFYRHNIYSQTFCFKWIFSHAILFPGHLLILSNSRTFPGPGKWLCNFPGFPGHMGTLHYVLKFHRIWCSLRVKYWYRTWRL